MFYFTSMENELVKFIAISGLVNIELTEFGTDYAKVSYCELT